MHEWTDMFKFDFKNVEHELRVAQTTKIDIYVIRATGLIVPEITRRYT